MPNEAPSSATGGDKSAELLRLKKEYHQMMLRELQKKQLSMSAKTSNQASAANTNPTSQNNTVRFSV
jgi:hypothetical protein